MSTSPPLQLIDWWLAKTPLERKAFLEADNTSVAVRRNIAVVEAYCLANSYRVFRDSTLRPRPFAPHLLRGSGNAEAPPRALTPGVPPVCAAEHVQIGGRYAVESGETDVRAAEVAFAATHIAGVTGRVDAFLRDEGVLADSGAKRHLVATLIVRALTEAITAALQRTGVSAAIDAYEREASVRVQRRAALVLPLSTKASSRKDGRGAHSEGTAAATAESSAASPRPIAAHLGEAVGLWGLWRLIAAAPAAKHARDGGPVGVSTDHSNPWRSLREAALQRLLPPPSHTDGASPSDGSPAANGDAAAFPFPPRVDITAADMNFAILRLLSLPEYHALLHPRAA